MSSVTDQVPYRGPYADGPPPEALRVDPPPLKAFGLAELRRFFTIGWVMALCVTRALARWLLTLRLTLSMCALGWDDGTRIQQLKSWMSEAKAEYRPQ